MILKNNHIMTAALLTGLTFGLASCSDDFNMSNRRETTITATAGGSESQTRTAINNTQYIGGETGILWTPEDVLGVFGDKDTNVPFSNSLSAPKGRTQFTGVMAGNPKYAYFPYSQTAGTDVTALKGNLGAEQLYDPTTRYISGDYKYGTPRTGAADEFDFTHIFSMLQLVIDPQNTAIAGENLTAVTVTAPTGRVISGDFTFSAVDGTYTMAGGQGSDKVGVKLSQPSALVSGSPFTCYASCAPAIKEGDVLSISIVTEDHVATFNATAACDFLANSIYTFDLKLDRFSDEAHGWTLRDTPKMKSFEFTVAANQGKILDKKVQQASNGSSISETTVVTEALTINGHEVTGMIPYLYNYNLVPTFTVSDGAKVKVNGVEQKSGESMQDFSSPVKYVLEASDGTETEYTVSVTNTGLPVVVVEQSSTLSGGSWRNWFGNVNVRSKDSDWASDDYITIYNADGTVDVPRAAAGMRLRGNTTQSMPKKPFAVKFDKKQAVLGMPKHKRWVLLANWMDCSMIRNHAAFVVAHAVEKAWKSGAVPEGIKWNPSGTNVELVVDGRHVGDYYLCEQIKIDKDRLNIKDCYEDVLKDTGSATFENCGYLLEFDDNYDENCKFITSSRWLPVMFKDDVPDDILNAVKTKINRIDSNLANSRFSTAYSELDIYSVIDQWLIFEVVMGEEFRHPKSVYMYMDGGDSKLCAGPVWDFDWQTFPNIDNIKYVMNSLGVTSGYIPRDITGEWLYTDSSFGKSAEDLGYNHAFMWYPVLFRDANFRKAVQERWEAVYPYLQAVGGELMPVIEKNRASWEVNNKMWPTYYRGKYGCYNGDEHYTDYADVVQNIVAMYNKRLEWMNTQIKAGSFVTTAK